MIIPQIHPQPETAQPLRRAGRTAQTVRLLLLSLFLMAGGWLTPEAQSQERAAAPPVPGGSAQEGGSRASSATVPTPVIRPSESYRLAAGDTLSLSVYDEPRLKVECIIGPSGEASFELIGAVKVAGRTVREAEKLIETLYNKDYLVNPKVNLALISFAQHTVMVSGAVATPRAVVIPSQGRFDVLAAIAAAGGITEKANLRAAVLRRASSGATITCDITSIEANPSSAPVLLPGDSLTIPAKVDEMVIVSGEVNRPGAVKIPDTGRFDALTAITMAGDYTKLARPKNITLTRNGKIIRLDGAAMADGSDPPFELQPGDRLHVGKRVF